MSVLRKARKIKVVLAVTGAIGIVAMTAYVYHLKSVPTFQRLSTPVQTASQFADQTYGKESWLSEPFPLSGFLGYNNPAPPSVIVTVGRLPGQADSPDLSAPAVAVHSVLSLIDQAATDELAPCFIEWTGDTASHLYPRYLGHPIELVEVIEEDESARVIWKATVHTKFSLDGESRSPGETITLTTRLLRVEGLWKLVKLHDGGENGPQ